jgi:hypothetical protein
MNETTATADCAWIKLDLLARGVEYNGPRFLDHAIR